MGSTSDRDTLTLPDGARLLHIGPHKTGTTSLQGALWNARDAMRAQGVRHVGRTRNPSNAVRAVSGQPSPYSDSTPPPIRNWQRLVREIRGARESRVVVSSEFFAWAKPDVIRRIVDDLDPDRVHVAVTLRPLSRIIPSMWQQNVQAGHVMPFERWLEGVLNPRPDKANPAFWMLHHHDHLITRWADVVGVERLTAIVVDDRDHDYLLRVFEQLLGLRESTLAVHHDYANRSLTLPEVEAVRAFNAAYKAEGLPRALHARIMRFGAAQEMKRRQPPADEPRVVLPEWAEDGVADTAREIVAGIAASGVRIVGDLELLTARPPGRSAALPAEPLAVPAEIAASMAMGILVASGQTRGQTRGQTPGQAAGHGRLQFAEPIEMTRVPTYQVAGVVVLRAWRGLGSRWQRLRDAVSSRRNAITSR
jgi:hypothetical protein